MCVSGGGDTQIYQRKRMKQWPPSAGSGTGVRKRWRSGDVTVPDRWMNKARGLMHKARISTSKTAAEWVGFGCPCHERRGHSEMAAGSVSP